LSRVRVLEHITVSELALLCLVFFGTSIVSVVTGATSLITVPVMLSLGVEPRTALATNMLALTSLSAGASLPFLGGGQFERRGLLSLLALTFVGSLAGALLVFAVPENLIRIIVAVAMLTVGIVVLHPASQANAPRSTKTTSRLTGYAVTLLLAIYGGFFSGGYVTMLTVAWITLLNMPFRRAVATTKLANLISSLSAVAIFAARGAIDWRLGAVLSAAAFLGGILGARWTLLLNETWLRRVFVGAVLALAFKTLVYDVQWSAVL
jgi:uncharacterized membrane protein YfcA